MPEYSNSIIYVIMDKSTTQCYIGSTVKSLAKRMYYHQTALRSYNRWVANGKNGKKPSNYCSSITILQRNNYVEYELERFPCKTKKESVALEGQYINLYKSEIGTLCINKLREGVNVNDNRQAYNRQYNNDNKNKVKAYYLGNREHALAYQIAYNKRPYTCPDCNKLLTLGAKQSHWRKCDARKLRLPQEQATTESPTILVPFTNKQPLFVNSEHSVMSSVGLALA
jgi:hypothetical protein